MICGYIDQNTRSGTRSLPKRANDRYQVSYAGVVGVVNDDRELEYATTQVNSTFYVELFRLEVNFDRSISIKT